MAIKDIRPIHNEKEHKAALARIEALWDCKPDTPDAIEFEVIGILVDAYEKAAFPISPPNPIDAIKFRMEQMNYSRKDLENVIGTRGRVSEILSGKRDLSIKMIRRIHAQWGIPLPSLVGEAPKRAPRRKTATSKKTTKRKASAPSRSAAR